MLKWLRRSGGTDRPAPAPAPKTPPRSPDELMREAFPLHQRGDLAAAERRYREILALDPAYADAHYLLGRIAQDRGQHDQAIRHVREAIRCRGDELAFHRTLGELHFALAQWDEAAARLERAVELDPSNFECWSNLGCAHDRAGRLAQAAAAFERAVSLSPQSAVALSNLGKSLRDRGLMTQAIEAYGKARALRPQDPAIFSSYLFALNYSRAHTPEQIWREHQEFGRLHGRHAPLAPRVRPPAGRIRLGYFSPDLRAHPVHVFIEPVLAHHDRSQFEVFCYYLWPAHDAVSRRLQGLSEHWRDCAEGSDRQIAERIAQDGIDILVDLAGHTGGGRPGVLGHKPAPVIAGWLGYPNTTGLPTVDFRITDGVADPPGAERYGCEALVRLPGAQWCYLKPDVDLAVTPLPAAASGAVTFGSFNDAAKLDEEGVKLWAAILQRLGGSRLLLWGIAGEQRAAFARILEQCGIAAGRVEFCERTPFREQLAMVQRVDIALDTHPYSGVTTTFNSLWMGVPVLTLTGEWLASRSSASILEALGLRDWIAGSAPEYADLAARKAGDLAALGQLRATLRGRLEASALMDAPAFTRRLEAAYREMRGGGRSAA